MYTLLPLNGTLKIECASDVANQEEVDPVTGNPIFDKINYEVPISFHKPTDKDWNTQEVPGKNPGSVYITGWVRNYRDLPVALRKGEMFQIEYTEGVLDQVYKGDFYLLSIEPSKYQLSLDLLGLKVRGYLQNISQLE